jgi:erythromycin esterase
VRPPADQVRFAGVDAPTEWDGAQSPRVALRTLHTFLTVHCEPVPHQWSRIEALLGDDDRWTNPDVIMDPSQAFGASEEARELRAITDDLCWLLMSEVPQITASEALRDAELAARTAAGLLAYHAVLARTDNLDRLMRGPGSSRHDDGGQPACPRHPRTRASTGFRPEPARATRRGTDAGR